MIKFYFLKGKTATDVKKKLDAVLGVNSPSFKTVHKWIEEFKRGRTSCEDAARSGRPNEVTTEEMIEKVHKIVLADRRLKVRELAELVDISSERVHNILHQHLDMNKLCARWVPRLLTLDQKRRRMDDSTDCLQRFNRNKSEFLRRYITVDETWVHHYTPETKEQSKEWRKTGERPPKKAKTVLSAGKVMATVFWDTKGIIFIDYLEKGKTINGEYYSNLLQRLSVEIKSKRPHLAKKKVLFHQDNAPAHTSLLVMAKIHELGFELLPHPPYSPDLAPCDFHLFPNLKKWLGGKKFLENPEVVAAVDAYFEDLDKSFYETGISALQNRWAKCIELKGDYVEK